MLQRGANKPVQACCGRNLIRSSLGMVLSQVQLLKTDRRPITGLDNDFGSLSAPSRSDA